MIILIPTCQEYADILKAFVYFFKVNWEDCSYRKIFINSPHDYEGFENYRTNQDLGWTANILDFLTTEHIDDNILLLHDDYLLIKHVASVEIARIDSAIHSKIGYIRLTPYSDNEYNSGFGWKWPSKISYNDHFNLADMDSHSRNKTTRLPISHQPAIWNSAFIKTYFNPAWSPWQQEVLASREYCYHGTIKGIPCNYQFLTTKVSIYHYLNGIRDGKYSREFVDLINSTPALLPFNFVRDVVIPIKQLNKRYYKELHSRQTDGSYPKKYYG